MSFVKALFFGRQPMLTGLLHRDGGHSVSLLVSSRDGFAGCAVHHAE